MRRSILITSILIILISQYKLVKCKKMNLDELRDMLRPMSKSCKSKTGVSDEMVAATHQGIFPREKPLMCYFKCLSVMLKVMNKQGEIKPKDVERQIDLLVIPELAPTLKKIGTDCYNKVAPTNDACAYAFEIVMCGYQTDPKYYFLP
ncbi:general odorant-binding protein lush [Nasonia vitripennis]|uniref:Putative odorant binding protein 84 n=1 Tax=Nasonia vitripennis TaxID=7425 RepID=G8B1T9_NASVI|nr:general odorant-binding protein lush [Nasonia vitripennis]CCD17853.1 putative odorant binding protein 84 [Nasonia vitripennis]